MQGRALHRGQHESTKSSSRKWRMLLAAGWLLIAALLAGGAWLTRQPPRELLILKRATRVVAANPQSGSADYRWPDANPWLSDHELLLIDYAAVGNGPMRVFKRDVHSGQDVDLSRLTRRMRNCSGQPEKMQISPDGRYLALRGDDETYLLCNEGGALLHRWHTAGHFVWAGDSRHAAVFEADLERYSGEIVSYRREIVYSVERSRPTRTIAIAALAMLKCHKIGRDDADDLVLPTADRYVQAQPDQFPPGPSGSVTFTTLTQSITDTHSRTIRFDQRNEPGVVAVYLSPQADRVIWKVRTVRRSAIEHWMKRFIPSVRIHDRYLVTLWESNTDGQKMRSLGSMEVQPDAPYDEEPEEIRWLPGGQAISFVLHGSLFTLPVD